ncbi:hypothetical protein A9Z07_03975 [Acinetobacter sp. YK3]|nr:hypothetical protein A9Z07_03975 [Acinetobacter sp. YK3]
MMEMEHESTDLNKVNVMSFKLNTAVCALVLLVSASWANADGGLIFLEKNLQAQQQAKAKLENHIEHRQCKQSCK